MILVTLGTQDKPFTRLLEEVEKLIKNKVINEKVIVQAGHTKYTSKYMEIFDYLPKDELEKLIDEASILITHAGVGTIFDALKRDKKIIAVPRLKEYGEHTNNHQLEIVKEFEREKFIIPLYEISDLKIKLKNIDKFKPSKYKSNNKNMIDLLSKYIDEKETRSMIGKIADMMKKYKEIIMYLIFGVLTTIISLLVYYGLVYTILNPNNAFQLQIANIISWMAGVAFAYFTNRSYVFESKSKNKLKEASSFVLARVATLIMDMAIMFVGVTILKGNDKFLKLLSQIIVVVTNYVFSKLFVFKK